MTSRLIAFYSTVDLIDRNAYSGSALVRRLVKTKKTVDKRLFSSAKSLKYDDYISKRQRLKWLGTLVEKKEKLHLHKSVRMIKWTCEVIMTSQGTSGETERRRLKRLRRRNICYGLIFENRKSFDIRDCQDDISIKFANTNFFKIIKPTKDSFNMN